MRRVRADKKEERKEALLRIVVEEFIRTGRPVGSLTLSAGDPAALSAPSIRNVLAELEREGFLTHPHTSAGRVPTDKGYRHYVDSLKRFWTADHLEAAVLRRELEARSDDMEELLRSVPWALARMSGWLGFVITPALRQADLRSVEVLSISETRALVVFIGGSGLVRHRTVVFQGSPSKKDIVRRAAEGVKEKQIYVAGEDTIFSAPDFESPDLGPLFQLFAHKPALLELLEDILAKDVEKEEVVVRIGTEIKPAVFKNLSVVAAGYGVEGGPRGILGILGSRRMNYSRVVGVVGFMSFLINEIMRHWQSNSTFPGFELTRKMR